MSRKSYRKEDPGSETFVFRGGKKLEVRKIEDRFVVRPQKRQDPQALAEKYEVKQGAHFHRQQLEEFIVAPEDRDEVMERIRTDSGIQFASHVFTIGMDPTPMYLDNQITVQFAEGTSADTIEDITQEFGLALIKDLPNLSNAYVFAVIPPQAKMNPLKICMALEAREDVAVAEANLVVQQKTFVLPTDTLFPHQWHLHHAGGIFLEADSHIHAPETWDLTSGERAIVVAVADDSVDLNHVDFQGEGKIVSPRDFFDQDFEPHPELIDDNHGTACAGVAVAEENGQGVVGVAPGCALMPIRTSGWIDDNSIEALFEWVADQGAAVVSCSWGAAARNFPLSLRMQAALTSAATQGRQGRGCIICFAAGNENRPVDGMVDESGWPGNTPNGTTQWHNGFAAHPHVMAVAACTSLGKKSAYSNWGQEISVAGPSNNAPPGRTYPEVVSPTPGRGIVTTDRLGPLGYSGTDYTFSFGGTSSACPLVAGAAALVLSANPDLTSQEVREILESTADKIEDHDPDPQLGNTFGTYDTNGHSFWFGHGKVNAFRAVTEAIRRKTDEPSLWLKKTSNRVLAIPDNNTTGVTDHLTFAETGSISAVRITLDITHTYIGDLYVTITSPIGTSIVLHDRNGGNTKNLQTTYDQSTTPGLTTLIGQSLSGPWVLQVKDLAARDTGTVVRWEIEVQGQAALPIILEESPGTLIPDNNAQGIQRVLTTLDNGRIKDLAVSVDITHTYIGDLVVSLQAPSGLASVLHSQAGGSSDNLITTYTPATTSALQTFKGESLQGDWTLRVTDLAAQDIGKLNNWKLTLIKEME